MPCLSTLVLGRNTDEMCKGRISKNKAKKLTKHVFPYPVASDVYHFFRCSGDNSNMDRGIVTSRSQNTSAEKAIGFSGAWTLQGLIL